jgi:hypothetical protein
LLLPTDSVREMQLPTVFLRVRPNTDFLETRKKILAVACGVRCTANFRGSG